MTRHFEKAETHYNVGYNDALQLMENADTASNCEIYVMLDNTTFLLLQSSKFGKLFKALYDNVINVIIDSAKEVDGLDINIEKIVNIIPIADDLPLIGEFLEIEIDDSFIFMNNGEVLSIINNLLEPENIEEFNSNYDVNFSDIDKLEE